MKKIYIIGSVASGKTTLARTLSMRTRLPWYELDSIIHQESETGRNKRTPGHQVELINHIDKNGGWIIEGTYRKSCHCLLDMADEVIFLDTLLWKRKFRIITRFIKQRLHLEKCHYKSSIRMLKLMFDWTNDFEDNRNDFIEMLYEYGDKLIIVKNTNNIIWQNNH